MRGERRFASITHAADSGIEKGRLVCAGSEAIICEREAGRRHSRAYGGESMHARVTGLRRRKESTVRLNDWHPAHGKVITSRLYTVKPVRSGLLKLPTWVQVALGTSGLLLLIPRLESPSSSTSSQQPRQPTWNASIGVKNLDMCHRSHLVCLSWFPPLAPHTPSLRVGERSSQLPPGPARQAGCCSCYLAL